MRKFLFVLPLNLIACSRNLGDCDPALPMSQCPNDPCYTPAGCSEYSADMSDQFDISSNVQAESPNFLYLPTSDQEVYVQQGWIYDYTTANHCGIDYRNGTSGEWLTFEVTASHDGDYVCTWSDTWGYYVRGTYFTADHTYYTIYAHLESCEFDSSSFIAGDRIGMAGLTGSANGYLHLHYEIGVDDYGQPGCSESVDPYDLYSTAGDYPDIYNTSAECGGEHLWTQCPPIPAETSPTTHLFTVEPVSTDSNPEDYEEFNLYGYEVSGSGDKTALTGNFFSYLNTGNTNTIVAWLSGDVDGDGYDDVVQVRTKDSYTYAQVYLGDGEGGLNTQTRWKKTPGTATNAFLGYIDGDGKDDLILTFANTDSTLTWKYFVSSGSGFSDATIWHSSFGYTVSQLLVGDFNGNGQVEAFNGTSGTNNVLTWQRLNGSGTITNISTTFGLSTDEFVVADSDNDGSDELIRLDEWDSSVECEAAHYHNSSSTFTTTTCGTDVGGTDGDYAIYLLDTTGTYPDLIRSTGTTLYLASGNGSTFEEQSDQHAMVSGLNLTDSQATFLFGNFGTRTSKTIQSVDGDMVDPLDEDDEEPTPPADDDTGDDDTTAEPTPDCDVDNDGQTATSCGGTDCNDGNASVYYGAPETCGNGINDDCVGDDVPCSELDCTDNDDNDLDNYVDCNDPDCSSSSACSTPTASDSDGDGYNDSIDCGWWSANIYPGAPELADWVDNDCDGTIDDGCNENCNNVYWNGCSDDYAAYYATGSLTYICTGSSSTGPDTDGDGYPDAQDCAWWDATTYPGAPERSDWNDNDCDGTVDEGCDGSCGGNYSEGCHDDYEWWYRGTAPSAPIC